MPDKQEELRLRVGRRLVLSLLVVFLLAGVGIVTLFERVKRNMEDVAVSNAISLGSSIAEQYRYLRGYYTEQVVSVVTRHNLHHLPESQAKEEVTTTTEYERTEASEAKLSVHNDITVVWDHRRSSNAIPLPASMIQDLSAFTTREDGVKISLYSPFPFPNREGRQLDAFQKDAWKYFSQPENQASGAMFSRKESRETQQDGEVATVMRIALADTMVKNECVSCHNAHPETPKNNWKVGDLRGVLEVAVPIRYLDRNVENTLNWVLLVVGGAAVLILLIVWRFTEDLSSSLSIIRRALYRLSRGDTNQQELQIASWGGLVLLGDSFNDLQSTFRTILFSIEDYSATLDRVSNSLSEITQIQQSSASEQLVVSEETKIFLMSLLDSSAEVVSLSELVLSNAMITQDNAEEIASYIEKLSSHAAGIGELSGTITEISLKSDLLALNATLEGNKAGEAGQGFSLVAMQMQQLAEQVMLSTKEIKELTSNITKSLRDTVIASRETNKLALDTTNSAQQITVVAEEHREGAERMSEALDNIVRSANQTSTATFSIVDISFTLLSLSSRLRETITEFKKIE